MFVFVTVCVWLGRRDAPYWRGYVWMPINYLALQSLQHYAHSPETPPATAERAQELYSELRYLSHLFRCTRLCFADALGIVCRTNLLKTVLGSYHKTGFFWEQYDDRSGDGLRSHPFTGWTALVVNIMGERFD